MIKVPSNFQDLTNNFQRSKSFTRLASGTRIVSAADDPAGLSVTAALSASISSLSVASQNISYAFSRFQIADGGLAQVSDISTRLQELATQAANGTLSGEQRDAIQNEFSQLTAEITRIAEGTEFNGQKVFDGSALVTQVGIDSSANSQITGSGVDLAALAANLTSQSLTTQASAVTAIDQIAQFSQNISKAQGALGASGSRLVSAQTLTDVISENLAAARSQIADIDVAQETANLIAQTVRQNANAALNAQASNLNAGSVLNLLGGGKK